VASDILAPASAIRWRPALDELVLLNVATGHSWLLDGAGAAVWDAVVTTGSVTTALDLLSGALPDEVDAFVWCLVDAGALVFRPPGG